MNLRISYLTLVFVCLLFNTAILKSQCSSCKFTASNSVSSYTLNPGEVLCVNAGDDYTGAIYLSGGVICNSGTIHNIIYQSGTGLIENYGTYAHTGNINFALTGELVMNCYSGSIIRITGDVTAHGSLLSHMLTIRQFGGSIVDIGGNFNCSGGRLRIQTTSPPEVVFAARNIFNIGGQFSITGRGNLNLNINEYSTFNVFGSANFMGSGTKQITNSGEMNFNQNFSIGGNGGGFGFFNLKNYGNFSVSQSFNSSYSNGNTIIENYGLGGSDGAIGIGPITAGSLSTEGLSGSRVLAGMMSIGKSYSQSTDQTNFYNYGNVVIARDASIIRGSFNNKGYLNSRDVEVRYGNMTNDLEVNCNRDLVVSNSLGVVNNNNSLRVAREFSNKGTVNFGKKSLLLTKNFTHLNGGNIYGPAELSHLNGVPDSSDYALIDITDYSDNNGNLRQHLIVYDENFSGTGIALDDYHGNTARLGMPPVIIGPPPCFRNIWSAILTSNPPNPICAGSSVVLTANAFNGISLTQAPVLNYVWLPANVTTIPPTNTFNTGPITANTIFTVNIKLLSGCVIKQTVNVTVSNLTASAGSNVSICLGSSISLNGQGINGTPGYNYSWSPATGLSSSTIFNPVANPSTTQTYILTVTDSQGCTATSNVIVTVFNTTPVTASANPNTVVSGQSSILSASPIFASYNWTPGNISGQSITVTPGATTTYYVTATDDNGCVTTAAVTVYIAPVPYAVLRRSLDGGYYKVPIDKKVYFKYTGEYNNDPLSYKIYKPDRTLLSCPINTPLKVYGDNRYSVDLTCITTTTPEYYVLEVMNEKKELFYLKFKY